SMRERYRNGLSRVMAHRGFTLGCVSIVVLASMVLLRIVGEDFFPTVDSGMIRLHVRVPVGTRLEESSRILDGVEEEIRSIIPASQLKLMTDHVGLPVYWALLFYQTDTLGPQDADLQIQLTEKHDPSARYARAILDRVRAKFPQLVIYPQAADIVSQVLSFGLSAPIDVQITGRDLNQSFAIAQKLKNEIQTIPGAANTLIAHLLDYPTLHVQVDRDKALELALTP